MKRDLVLIFKVNDYVNSIDRKLGTPINNYYYTAKYAFKCYGNSHYFKNIWEKILFKLNTYKVLLFIILYEVYLKISN